MYVEDINLASVFMIFISDFGIVPAMRYFFVFHIILVSVYMRAFVLGL